MDPLPSPAAGILCAVSQGPAASVIGRAARIALAAAVVSTAGGCAAVIQPYRGIPKAAADDPVIRKYKFEKHAVSVTLVTVTTYYSGGGASTRTYRLYEVAGCNYPLGALPAYFKDSGQSEAAGQLGRGIRIMQIGVPATYAASALLITTGVGLFPPGGGSDDPGSSGVFGKAYNWPMIISGVVLVYAGPWLLDKITWNSYLRPSIETFNRRLKKDLELTMDVEPDKAVAAVAWHF